MTVVRFSHTFPSRRREALHGNANAVIARSASDEAIQRSCHSGMRRRDKIAKLFRAEGAGPAMMQSTLLRHSGSRGTRLSGIHIDSGGYGFRAQPFGPPRNDKSFRKTTATKQRQPQ
jgi:hypothetical protein